MNIPHLIFTDDILFPANAMAAIRKYISMKEKSEEKYIMPKQAKRDRTHRRKDPALKMMQVQEFCFQCLVHGYSMITWINEEIGLFALSWLHISANKFDEKNNEMPDAWCSFRGTTARYPTPRERKHIFYMAVKTCNKLSYLDDLSTKSGPNACRVYQFKNFEKLLTSRKNGTMPCQLAEVKPKAKRGRPFGSKARKTILDQTIKQPRLKTLIKKCAVQIQRTKDNN